jgi:C-terminal processing protease CtpA/Prc
MGLDLEGDTFRRVDRMLFSPEMVKASRNLAPFRASRKQMNQPWIESESVKPSNAEQNIRQQRVNRELSEYAQAASSEVKDTESTMPLVFAAKPFPVGTRQVAHVRIHTFMVDDDDQFVNEFVRLITLPSMPQDGLIIDVRGNGGGLIWAGERLLQLLTPRTIEPCRAQFISTPQNVELCRQASALKQWLPSLERAISTGAPYSAAFPITPPARCNDIGQRYYGPVVLITDARCYSTTDIFAAGFRDHGIGLILGTDKNMGAGGANVWTLDQIRALSGTAAPAPLQALPRGAGMRVAIRRTLRVGAEAGTEMEDLGIMPDDVHPMTKADVLQGNPQLMAHAVKMLDDQLKGAAARVFNVTSALAGAQASLSVACKRVDYLEVVVDGRGQGSHDVLNDAAQIMVAANAGSRIELRGYLGTGELVCTRRWTL